MNTSGNDFLGRFVRFPTGSFEHRFVRASTRLKLGELLDRNELNLLMDAAFRAALCNIAFNGMGGFSGIVRPEHEPRRRRLEQEFMEAREIFYASPGWQLLEAGTQRRIQDVFLSVFVTDDNLAW